MFDRLIALIGEDKIKLIGSVNILLLGVGGVGGYVAEALVRSGIAKITIVDADTIERSNLNRQIIALHSTLDKAKVDVMKERLEDINPSISVDTRKVMLDETLSGLELLHYDYIVDCIDDTPVKVALAKKCLTENHKLLIATGTAKKLDPTKLTITSLDKTSYDPLAKKMRSLLKGYDIKKLIVLASTEEAIKTEENVLGSAIFVPAAGGLLLASYIIKDIIK